MKNERGLPGKMGKFDRSTGLLCCVLRLSSRL
jgi:hypothetical protein